MKFNIILILFAFFSVFSSTVFAQTKFHTSISQLDISYLETNITDSIAKYKSQATITFKSDSAISIVHFKIINPDDNSIVYEVNYPTITSIVTSASGDILFKKEIKSCTISTSKEFTLKTYLFQIITEDAMGNMSEAFIDYK